MIKPDKTDFSTKTERQTKLLYSDQGFSSTKRYDYKATMHLTYIEIPSLQNKHYQTQMRAIGYNIRVVRFKYLILSMGRSFRNVRVTLQYRWNKFNRHLQTIPSNSERIHVHSTFSKTYHTLNQKFQQKVKTWNYILYHF